MDWTHGQNERSETMKQGCCRKLGSQTAGIGGFCESGETRPTTGN